MSGLFVLFTMVAFLPASAQEVDCSEVVGTYLFTNSVSGSDKSYRNRSILSFSSDGVVLSIDSNEQGADEKSIAFGDSAGGWRCASADEDGKIPISGTALNFDYPSAEGTPAQLNRWDFEASYDPSSRVLEMSGSFRFLELFEEPYSAEIDNRPVDSTFSGSARKLPF